MQKNSRPKTAINNSQSNSTSTEAQRLKLLAHLEAVAANGCTTIEAREDLDIISPAPRVHELRWNHGKNIQTIWDVGVNAQGKKHRVARYVLMPGKWNGNKRGGK
jgi:hypothetical protein